MKDYKCGDLGLHFYKDGPTCLCGQIPEIIFFAKNCTCGEGRNRHPVHKPDCVYVEWGRQRNLWIDEHPNTDPKLDRCHIPVTRGTGVF